MNTEPIRLPALIALVVILACAVAISLLVGLELEQSVAVVLGVLVVVAPAVAVAESKRARTDSPATVAARWEEHAASVASDLADRTEPAQVLGTASLDLSTPAVPGETPTGLSIEDLAAQLAAIQAQINARG